VVVEILTTEGLNFSARFAKLFGAVFAEATVIKEKEIRQDIIKREVLKNKHFFNLMQLSIILKPFLFVIIRQIQTNKGLFMSYNSFYNGSKKINLLFTLL
jgi:hypothetical protein